MIQVFVFLFYCECVVCAKLLFVVQDVWTLYMIFLGGRYVEFNAATIGV